MNFPAESAVFSYDRPPVVVDIRRDAVRPQKLARGDWIRLCANRLTELCFHDDRTWMLHLASELWEDLPGFDPVMAAELEHESWLVGS